MQPATVTCLEMPILLLRIGNLVIRTDLTIAQKEETEEREVLGRTIHVLSLQI
jgi:hypothetical protein